jgi:DNA gyrase subunit A
MNLSEHFSLEEATYSETAIRMHIDTIRTMGRAAQGVRLINLKANAGIAAIARVPRSEDEEELGETNEIPSDNPSQEGNGTVIENSADE